MVPLKTYTDAGLVEALQSKEAVSTAVRFLYHEYYDFLSLFIRQNKGSEQDAEDIFQEVVVAFVELVQQQKFRGESSVKTFLYALNRNIWFNELKKRQRSDKREFRYEMAREKDEADISQYIDSRESKKQVLEVVERLGEVCRKILLAFYYENKSINEVLQVTGYDNEQVVRNKKYKCLKQLEQMLTSNPAMAKTLKTALSNEQ